MLNKLLSKLLLLVLTKKMILFLVSFLSTSMLFSGCAKEQAAHSSDTEGTSFEQKTLHDNSETKDTPVIIGKKGTISTSLEFFDLKKATEQSDVIAEVQIIQWCGEIATPSEKTIFNANILKTFKNSINPNMLDIKILQYGNSNFTVKDYPLFKVGDKLLLFLKKAEDMDNTFWILGEYSTIFEIKELNNVNYCLKMIGDYPEYKSLEVDKSADGIKNDLNEIEINTIKDFSKFPEFSGEVKSSYMKIFSCKQVFKKESIIMEIEKLLQSKE